MRELWGMRVGLALAVALAFVVALSSVTRVSLFPPGLAPRPMEMATATTHVLVDTPRSVVLDRRAGTLNFQSLSSRAVLLGNVMSSPPVRAAIARRADIPAGALQATTPLTPDQPRPVADAGGGRHMSDLTRSLDQYRLSLRTNPTVPILDIYAQAPTADKARRLADGAVDGLRDYLRALAARQRIAPKDQVQLEQLGRAQGGVINHGVGLQVALLSFMLVFGAACAGLLFVARVRRGWQAAGTAPRPQGRAA
jgi:hypothetical protein